jgi:tetratricopeptide (TPR) repeat protein
MKLSGDKNEREEIFDEVINFPALFSLRIDKENLTINTNVPSKSKQEKRVNQAIKLHVQGKISEATRSYQYLINQGFSDHRVFSNYGVILNDLGNLHEAELSTRKAIELNPKFANAHSNLGIILKDLGNLHEAELSTRKAIELNPKFANAHSNLGIILKGLGKLEEAELSARKAIELNPKFAEAYSSLGIILKDLGNLEEAELLTRKAIALNPDLAVAYYSLSLLKYSEGNNKAWKDKLFSNNILNKKLPKEQVDIYFARANILHKEKKYEESSKYIQAANKLKLDLYPSNSISLLNKSSTLLIESEKQEINQIENKKHPESIFIVGMPRSGSTLLESILSMNINVTDLGEINILEESFLEQKKIDQKLNLSEIYYKKIRNYKNEFRITTNKSLYNYLYAGIILSQMPNAKIIHCFRNPLDNILSIYRAHFTVGNEYSSSLVDSTKIYLDQEEIMTKYKKRFTTKIYSLNYDSLVSNPNIEIKSLISWLGWEWDASYLSPHLNTRSVSTASNVEVRSPINSKSISGWKNYKDMLKPAIEILTKANKYRDLLS